MISRALMILFVAIPLSVSGELLLKYGMNQHGFFGLSASGLLPSLVRIFTNPFILAGFALIFSGSIFWLSVISRVELSYAYPMLSLSYVLTVAASWFLFSENVTPIRIGGVLIICLGVYVVSRS
ncbi:MAG: EamA family transporter [Chloroflexi bacterium]|nr:EamA family transporter [Chloroflexota bacterium]